MISMKAFEKRVHYIDRKEPSERELKGAAELIKSSKNRSSWSAAERNIPARATN